MQPVAARSTRRHPRILIAVLLFSVDMAVASNVGAQSEMSPHQGFCRLMCAVRLGKCRHVIDAGACVSACESRTLPTPSDGANVRWLAQAIERNQVAGVCRALDTAKEPKDYLAAVLAARAAEYASELVDACKAVAHREVRCGHGTGSNAEKDAFLRCTTSTLDAIEGDDDNRFEAHISPLLAAAKAPCERTPAGTGAAPGPGARAEPRLSLGGAPAQPGLASAAATKSDITDHKAFCRLTCDVRKNKCSHAIDVANCEAACEAVPPFGAMDRPNTAWLSRAAETNRIGGVCKALESKREPSSYWAAVLDARSEEVRTELRNACTSVYERDVRCRQRTGSTSDRAAFVDQCANEAVARSTNQQAFRTGTVGEAAMRATASDLATKARSVCDPPRSGSAGNRPAAPPAVP